MKKKFDIYLLRMTLLKFIFLSMLCWSALYAAYQYSETSLTLKIIAGCSLVIIIMNVVRFIFDNEPRIYFLLYCLGIAPTIGFVGYSILLMLRFEGKTPYIYLTSVYSIALLFFVLTVQDIKVREINIRSKVISIYTVNKNKDILDDKVIDIYKEVIVPSEKTSKIMSKIELLIPFIPAFNLFLVKYFSSLLGLVLITCLMMFLTTSIDEFGRNAYNFVHLYTVLQEMEE